MRIRFWLTLGLALLLSWALAQPRTLIIAQGTDPTSLDAPWPPTRLPEQW